MNTFTSWSGLLLAGFGLGLSLIVAIGAQNAFVLKQGLRRAHVLPVVLICALSDAVLILLGITGMGAVVAAAPAAMTVLRWVGAAFLVGYGLLAARRAWSPTALSPSGGSERSLLTVVATCLAFTWLNPHVYLDTVLLLGSIANSHGSPGRWAFGAGAVTASLTWFTSLGFGARLLGGVFARPLAWRILDGGIAVTMIAMGLNLVL
jgi:L-lysine exporter family protein LysE/ArgO